MSTSLFNLLKRIYLSLSRFAAIRNAREWWRTKVQLHWWPWYDRPPTKFGLEKNPQAYKHELIVSLTSFPARIHLVSAAVSSILKQSLKPNRVVLWLGEDKFSNKEANLPKGLLALQEFGLEIGWCKDVKSFTKLVFALQKWPEGILVTADDDYHYPRHWLCSLYNSYLTNEQCIHTVNVHQIRLDDFGKPEPFENWSFRHVSTHPLFRNVFNTGPGALFPPHCLHSDVIDISSYLRLSPNNDDFWCWAMAVRVGTKTHFVQEGRQHFVLNPRVRATPELWAQNMNGGGNTRCFFTLLEAYPEIAEKLREEQAVLIESEEVLNVA